MSKVIRRVPENFDWPLKKVWSGYKNPYDLHECSKCHGSGKSIEYKQMISEWYSSSRVINQNNPYHPEIKYNILSWQYNLTELDINALIDANVYPELSDELTITYMNDLCLKQNGHKSDVKNIIIRSRLNRENKPIECKNCNGNGQYWWSDIARDNYNGWVSYEPPTGDGYQIWDMSKCYPISPVFNNLSLFEEYCEKIKFYN